MISNHSTAMNPGRVSHEKPEWTRDEFLAMVSHELRNPIQAILSWAEVVSRKPDLETSERAIECIKRGALQGAKLINQLMDFSRISNGSLKLSEDQFSLIATLEEAIEIVTPQAWAKAIKIDMQINETSITLVGDAARLQQVFINLLSNAIKFTPREGLVQIRVECRQNYAEVSVRDTGRGISPEFLPHVFERFRQQALDPTNDGGLGLGLAISRYLVEEHRGTIQADSPGNGKGATFTVCLPRLREKARAQSVGGHSADAVAKASAITHRAALSLHAGPSYQIPL